MLLFSHSQQQTDDDFGSAENVQKICHFCDDEFHFDFDDCVADKGETRQKCRKWITGIDTLVQNMQLNQSIVPALSDAGRAPLAFSNTQKRQKIRV